VVHRGTEEKELRGAKIRSRSHLTLFLPKCALGGGSLAERKIKSKLYYSFLRSFYEIDFCEFVGWYDGFGFGLG
jgi:hypothetical protein